MRIGSSGRPLNSVVRRQETNGGVPLVWKLPGILLWLPTAANAAIGALIFDLWWDRTRHVGNTAQGEIGPFMLIIAVSAPIAAVVLIGWGTLAIMRAKVPSNREANQERGPIVLALVNVVAPFVLFYCLRQT